MSQNTTPKPKCFSCKRVRYSMYRKEGITLCKECAQVIYETLRLAERKAEKEEDSN